MSHYWIALATVFTGALIAVELKLASNWALPYYRHGFPVLFRRYKVLQPAKFAEVLQQLRWRYGGHHSMALEFRFLTPEMVAFRAHTPFPQDPDPWLSDFVDPSDPWNLPQPGLYTGSREMYISLMHGALHLDVAGGVLTVKGYLNWYVVWLNCFWFAIVLSKCDPGSSAVCRLMLFLGPLFSAIIVLIQGNRYIELAEIAAKFMSVGRIERYRLPRTR